jgi:hypothetical protein
MISYQHLYKKHAILHERRAAFLAQIEVIPAKSIALIFSGVTWPRSYGWRDAKKPFNQQGSRGK